MTTPVEKAKGRARTTLHRAIQQGTIQPQPCTVCGSFEAEAHHKNYDTPLDVEWLCRQHHNARHAVESIPDPTDLTVGNRGRPLGSGDGAKFPHRVTVPLSPEQYAALVARSEQTGQTAAEIIRAALTASDRGNAKE